jgi:HEAT repeat protein
MLREKAAAAETALSRCLGDGSGPVRVAAAEALCLLGRSGAGLEALQDCLLKHESPWVRLQSANALQNLGMAARWALPAIEQATSDKNDYVKRAVKYTAAHLRGQR